MKYEQVIKQRIQVYSMCPGWCKSDMAGWEKPTKTAEMGADNIMFLVDLRDDVDPDVQGRHFSENTIVDFNA